MSYPGSTVSARFPVCLIGATLLLLLPFTARAQSPVTIVSHSSPGGTGLDLIAPTVGSPLDLTPNTASSEQAGDNSILAFYELQSVVLASALTVNMTSPKTAGNAGNAGSIAAGTRVDSLYFHIDGKGSNPYTETFVLSQDILGVIVTSNALTVSDSVVGLDSSAVTYAGTGTELSDRLNVVISGNTITLSGTTSTSADDFRVITTSIVAPEPGSLALGVIGALPLSGLVLRRRRRRRTPRGSRGLSSQARCFPLTRWLAGTP